MTLRETAPGRCRPIAHAAGLVGLLGLLGLLATGCDAPGSGDGAASGETGTPADAVETGYLEGARGASLHYRVVGREAPDTVVVVHGGPGAGMNSVLPDFARLSDGHVLIFYDQRGGGRSELPSDTALLDARYFVEDLESVRRHFRLERMKILAHSFGSIVAARYAREHPHRVERLVFHGATGPRRREAARLARGAASVPPDTGLARRARRLLAELLDGTATDPVATCRAWEAAGRELARARGDSVRWRGSVCEAPARAVRYYFRHTARFAPATFGDWDFTSGLEDVTAPLLVIWGARDSAAVPGQRAWASSVANGRLLLLPGVGKAAIAGRPEQVEAAIDTFLDGSWPAGADAVSP